MSILRSRWFWVATTGVAGYLAYHEYQKVKAEERVAYEAQQTAAQLQAQIDAMGEGTSADSIKAMAKAWWDQFATSTTVADAEKFLGSLNAEYIPLVIQQWRDNGMSLDFLLALAKDFGLLK